MRVDRSQPSPAQPQNGFKREQDCRARWTSYAKYNRRIMQLANSTSDQINREWVETHLILLLVMDV